MSTTPDPDITRQRMDADMPDYSDPAGDDFVALPHDRTPVRSMAEDDLDAIIGIDKKLTGRARRDYYEAKLKEVMDETGVRVSLVAEVDGRPVGYIMARVDYGEFGRAEAAAVIDTIGVDPDYGRRGIGFALLSQLMTNLDALHVEAVRTTVAWNNFPLLGFLSRSGFTPAQQLVLSLSVT
jgi:ribosomal protein S18 acetylase RimI-like enzyme